MRTRTVLLVSLVLNVALASALVTWLSLTAKNTPRVVRSPNLTGINSNNMLRIVKTNVLVRANAFTWQQVESPDYAVYVENLRSLGMPNTTIRDIIIADVDQLFTQRRRDEAAKRDFEWWRSTPSPEVQSNTLSRARGIEAEREALLTKLLGPDWQKGRAEDDSEPLALTGPVLGNLSDEMKAKVQEIAAGSRSRVTDYLAQAAAAGEAPNPVELAKMREEARQQLAAILSPLQLEEFLLRYSENAVQLRREIAGLTLTPDEFRSLFQALDPIEREIQVRYSGEDVAALRARQGLEQQKLAALRNTLGAERFAAYQMVRDPAYRDALAAAEQAGAGDEAATALYEIARATREEINRIRNDTTLTDAQKLQQMRNAALEQRRARDLVLGETPALEPPAPNTAAITPPAPGLYSHSAEPGETLPFLAVRFGVSMDALVEVNPGLNFNRIAPGTRVNVPPAGTGTPPPLGGAPLPLQRR
jgi:DNA-binding transcriptional regulator YiaG